MQFAPIVAQLFEFPQSGGEWLVWLAIVVAIAVLWLMIKQTRQRAHEDYLKHQRRRREPSPGDPRAQRRDAGSDGPDGEETD
jgi:heme exporter protein D